MRLDYHYQHHEPDIHQDELLGIFDNGSAVGCSVHDQQRQDDQYRDLPAGEIAETAPGVLETKSGQSIRGPVARYPKREFLPERWARRCCIGHLQWRFRDMLPAVRMRRSLFPEILIQKFQRSMEQSVRTTGCAWKNQSLALITP